MTSRTDDPARPRRTPWAALVQVWRSRRPVPRVLAAPIGMTGGVVRDLAVVGHCGSRQENWTPGRMRPDKRERGRMRRASGRDCSGRRSRHWGGPTGLARGRRPGGRHGGQETLEVVGESNYQEALRQIVGGILELVVRAASPSRRRRRSSPQGREPRRRPGGVGWIGGHRVGYIGRTQVIELRPCLERADHRAWQADRARRDDRRRLR